MNEFTNSISSGLNSFMNFLPTLLGAIALLILAWVLAILVRKGSKKGLKAAGFNRLLTKWGVAKTEEQADSTIDSISMVLYYLVWLIFLPGILSMLGLNAIASPITNMFDSVLSFIPKLLAAAVILALGIFIGRFVKNLVYNLLITLNIDKWVSKMTDSGETADKVTPSHEQKTTIAKVLANVVYIIILVPAITAALETLQIRSISEPIIMVLNQVLAAIPNIIVAVILIGVGVFLAKFVGDLIAGLLQGTGINKLNKYLQTPNSMTSSFDLAKIIGQIIQTVLIVFFVVEALNVLNLEVLNTIGTAIIGYLPLVLSALIILGIGLIGGSLLSSFITKTTGSRLSGNIVKYILIVMAVFMGLNQLKFATTIVNYAFLFIIGGLAVAFAISFGMGGREFAKRQLEKVETTLEKEEKK